MAVSPRLVLFVYVVALLAAWTGSSGAQEPGTGNGGEDASVVEGGRPVDIGGGRRLFLRCSGSGGPTVIFESGYHDSSTLWSEAEPDRPAVGPSVQERLSGHVRACSYDRPGTIVYGPELALTDRSTPVPMPRPASAAVADLHALIHAAKLPTPVVIVGHSMGGLLARLYAQTFPDEVAGLVFVDSFPMEMRAALGGDWDRYLALLATPGTTFDDDPAFEVFDVDASIDEVAASSANLPDVPMVVLSKTEPFPLPAGHADLGAAVERAWTRTAQDLVELGVNTPHVIATGSDHYIQVRQPDLVAESTLLVIERAARR